MQIKIYVCENCQSVAKDEKQLRKENWIQIHGGACQGISVWLDKPRKTKKGVSSSYMITVGFEKRDYHFCSTKCLVNCLNGNESI